MMRRRPTCMLLLPLLAVVCAQTLSAQLSEQDVRAKLDAVYAGKADQVRAELPGLLAQYPNDAGVRYIQAVLTTDGAQAVKRYEEIADKFPSSAWADDALYKVYQYDFSNGLYKKADSVMARLRTAYPRSIYAGAAPDAQPKKEDAEVRTVTPPSTSSAAKTADSSAKKAAGAAREPKPATATGYEVQAGLFSTEANARTAAERLSGVAGRTARVKPRASAERTVYLVVFDGFETAESAKRFSTELRTKHNIDSFVNPR